MCSLLPNLRGGIICAPYKMPKARIIGAGAGTYTSRNQGGGDKKQGLVSTTNRRVELVPYVRTRADGGNSRNWVFCMNQLGGVGRRYGQASGPGNRGGVHATCKRTAHRTRQLHPGRPKQHAGYGNPHTFRANHRATSAPSAPMNIWALGIGTANYNGPTLLVHPYYFYQGLESDRQVGLHCAPGTEFNSSGSDPVTVVGNGLALNMEFNDYTPDSRSRAYPYASIAAMRFPYDGRTQDQQAYPFTKLWKLYKGYTELNGGSASSIEGGGYYDALSLHTATDHFGERGDHGGYNGRNGGPLNSSDGTSGVPFRGYSYEGRVWKLWDDVSGSEFAGLQYGTPSSFVTTHTSPIGTFNKEQSCPSTSGLAVDCCKTGSVWLWNSVEGGNGQWKALDSGEPLTDDLRNDFPRYLANATSVCYTNQLAYGDQPRALPALQRPGALRISGTLLCDRTLGVMYAKSEGLAQTDISANDVGWVGYSFQCVDGRTGRNGGEAFPVPSLPQETQVGAPRTPQPPADARGSRAEDQVLRVSDTAPIASFAATPGVTGADNAQTFTFTATDVTAPNAPVVEEDGFINMPSELVYDVGERRFNAATEATSSGTAENVKIEVKASLLVTLYPGYIPLVLVSHDGSPPDPLLYPDPSCAIHPPTPELPEEKKGVQSIVLEGSQNKTRTVYYQYIRFMNQPAFRALWDEEYAEHHGVDWAVSGKQAPVSKDEACQWQNIVQNQLHQYVKDNNYKWPPGWQGRPAE